MVALNPATYTLPAKSSCEGLMCLCLNNACTLLPLKAEGSLRLGCKVKGSSWARKQAPLPGSLLRKNRPVTYTLSPKLWLPISQAPCPHEGMCPLALTGRDWRPGYAELSSRFGLRCPNPGCGFRVSRALGLHRGLGFRHFERSGLSA